MLTHIIRYTHVDNAIITDIMIHIAAHQGGEGGREGEGEGGGNNETTRIINNKLVSTHSLQYIIGIHIHVHARGVHCIHYRQQAKSFPKLYVHSTERAISQMNDLLVVFKSLKVRLQLRANNIRAWNAEE